MDAENCKLRDDNPEASEHVDYEMELGNARWDVAELTNQAHAWKQKFGEKALVMEDVKHRVAAKAERARQETCGVT